MITELFRDGHTTFYKDGVRIDIDVECHGLYYTVCLNNECMKRTFNDDEIVEFIRDMVGE